MVKQGGWSWNSGSAKAGVRDKHRCETCGRQYKMLWAKSIHQRECKIFNKMEAE